MLKALIVDDSSAELDVIIFLINKHQLPLATEIALNGEKAFEKIQQTSFDLLITDIRMPYMDGFELSKKSLSVNPELKIIISSGYKDFDYAKKAISLGISAYFLKPIQPTEFLNVVTQVVTQIERDKLERKRLVLHKTYARDQIVYQLIHELMTNEEQNKLMGMSNLRFKNTGYFLLISTNASDEGKLSPLQSDIRVVGEQLFGNNLHCIKITKNELLMILDSQKVYEHDDIKLLIDKYIHLVTDLYQLPVYIQCSSIDHLEHSREVYLKLSESNIDTNFQLNNSEIVLDSNHSNNSIKVKMIREYIFEHYSEELNLDILAGVVYIHPDYLSRIFKKETGMNLIHYITLYRLNKSLILLETTQQKIIDISRAVGYRDSAYYIRSFTKEFKTTPYKYRKKFMQT